MESPKVSVIIPIYNAEKYLCKCLDSVLRQSMRDIEVICVDDGSTDLSKDILQRYAKFDSRIIIIEQENQFAGIARNRGMEVARGEYLIFLDADDFFHPDMLECAYTKGEKYRADVVFFNVKCYSNQTKISFYGDWLYDRKLIPKQSPFSRKDVSPYIFQMTTAAPWNKLFRKSFIHKTKIVFQGTHSANDLYFVNLALALAERIVAISQPLLYYRVDIKGNLQNMQDSSPFDFYTACKALKDSLIQNHVFEQVEQSFVNFALSSVINTLRKLKDPQQFRLVCRELQKDIVEDLGIFLHFGDGDYFYEGSEYKILVNLMDPSFSQNYKSLLSFSNEHNDDCMRAHMLDRVKGLVSCLHEHGICYTCNEVLKTFRK